MVREAFQAETILELRPSSPDSDPRTRGPRTRGLLRRSIRSCTLCRLRDGARQPVPWRGPQRPSREPQRPSFAVVGEAPGPDEDRRGEPFVGRAGRALRALILNADLDYHQVAFVNAVCCYPADETVKTRFRPPHHDELLACRKNLLDQLEALGTDFVLLVGATALSTWRPDLRLKEAHGYPGVMLERWRVMATYHPAAVLRAKKRYKKIVQQDLEIWRKVLDDGLKFPLPTTCIRCDGTAAEWDRDGLGYCLPHWNRYKNRAKKARQHWKEEPPDQAALFPESSLPPPRRKGGN